MIKIVVPKSFSVVAPYFKADDSKQYLYITAVDGEAMEAVIRFKYRGEWAESYEILRVNPDVSDAVMDGLIRTMLFQTADAGCTACRFYDVDASLKPYFEGHGFKDCGGYLEHPDYIDEFFKPCPGCQSDGA